MQTIKRAALYARFSGHKQSESSIEDQLRRAREGLEKEGYVVEECHIYFDKAVSVSGGDSAKQVAFNACWKALKRGEFEVLVVDELSRLGRKMSKIINSVQEAHTFNVEIRSIMNGFRSKNPEGLMLLAVTSALAEMESTQISFRSSRGMDGVLLRGGMCGYPPYGYAIDGVTIPGQGAKWKIVEDQAEVVREMFEMRASGKSFGAIAQELNNRGIPTPKKARKGTGGFWRPATVDRILSNSVFRGVYTWNASSFSKAKAKREKVQLKPTEYQRPELRLVDDRVWHAANPGKKVSVRGFKHALGRLVNCARCNNFMTIKQNTSSVCVYCSPCFERNKQIGNEEGKGYYTSVGVVATVLEDAISKLFTPDFLTAYKKKLLRLNEGDVPKKIEALNQEIKLFERKIKGYEDILLENSERFDEFSEKLTYSRNVLSQARSRKALLEKCELLVDSARLESHLQCIRADFSKLCNGVLLSCPHPEEMNTVLRKLVSSIKVLKTSKTEWEILVTLSPAAELLKSFEPAEVENTLMTFKYKVRKFMSPKTHYKFECKQVQESSRRPKVA